MNIFHLNVLILIGITVAKTAPSLKKNGDAGIVKQTDEGDSENHMDVIMDNNNDSNMDIDNNDDSRSSIDPPFVHTQIIRMDDNFPEEDDMYICAGVYLGAEPSWIVGYVPLPENESVDMMTVYGCLQEPIRSQTAWSCNPNFARTVCQGPSAIIYRWKRSCEIDSARRQQVVIVGGAYVTDVVLMVHYKNGNIQDSSALELKILSGDYTETDAHYLTKYYTQMVDPGCAGKFNDIKTLLEALPKDGYNFYEYNGNTKQSFYLANIIGRSLDESYSSDRSSWEYQPELIEDQTWPSEDLKLGQVSGITTCPQASDVIVFHRAGRTWNLSDFDEHDVFIDAKIVGPIKEDVLMVLTKYDGIVKQKGGSDRFYMPHGVTCDTNGDLWLTDVALHQVFKISGKTFEIEVVLGEALTPGADVKHFCKPTDVAVDKATGNVFIADGYCNHRILKFSSNGTFIQEITAHGSRSGGRLSNFNIPHSLTIVESRSMLCVADRENARIQCFDTVTGEFVEEIKKMEFGGQVFAIAYDSMLDVMYAVNGQSERIPTQGYTLDVLTGEVLETWSPQKGFQMPHDVAVGPEGNVYVADLLKEEINKFIHEDNDI